MDGSTAPRKRPVGLDPVDSLEAIFQYPPVQFTQSNLTPPIGFALLALYMAKDGRGVLAVKAIQLAKRSTTELLLKGQYRQRSGRLKGSRSASTLRAEAASELHKNVIVEAKKYFKQGRKQSDIVGLLSKTHHRSTQTIRNILKKNGLWKK